MSELSSQSGAQAARPTGGGDPAGRFALDPAASSTAPETPPADGAAEQREAAPPHAVRAPSSAAAPKPAGSRVPGAERSPTALQKAATTAPEPRASAQSAGDDPHAFAAAFLKRMHPDHEAARPGRAVVYGVGFATAAAVAALALGLLHGTPPRTSAAAVGLPRTSASKDTVAGSKLGAATGNTGGTVTTRQPFASPVSRQAVPVTGSGGGGGAGGGNGGVTTPRTAAKAPQKAAVVQTSTMYAGPSCYMPPSELTFTDVTWYTGTNSNGTTGWSSSPTGGYTGCGGGAFQSMPMSGKVNAYHEWADWGFHFSTALTSCDVRVYIPRGNSIAQVGGAPADYAVFVNGSGTATRSFQINQIQNEGGWVDEGSVHVTAGQVHVFEYNDGINSNSGDWNAHFAVAQVSLTCES